MVLECIHFSGLPFTELTPAFAPHDIGRDKTGVAMQPTAEHDLAREGIGHARQVHKHGLGDVFRQVRIPVDQSYRRGIDQVDKTRNQLAKGWF